MPPSPLAQLSSERAASAAAIALRTAAETWMRVGGAGTVASAVILSAKEAHDTVHDTVEVETVLQGTECHWLHGVLSLSEQASLLDFIKERDRTAWDNPPACMNPTPKTLQLLAVGSDGATAPTLTFDCRVQSENNTIASEMVRRVARILRRRSLLLRADGLRDRGTGIPTSFSLAAIRYLSPDGHFPLHVDHCNDGSVVFLFSLGCHARFRVVAPTTEGGPSSSRELQLLSGDALAFDPSTHASIAHAVTGVGGEETCPAPLAERFDELRRCRYGIQCRVQF